MNRTDKQTGLGTSRVEATLACSACAMRARRADARFCATCGHSLSESYYAPADALLASYYQQRTPPARLRERALRRHPRAASGQATEQRTSTESVERNLSSVVAFIFVFFALVPYVGIAFCPVVVIAGGFGAVRAWRDGGAPGVARVGSDGALAVCCIICGFLAAGAQVLLWWAF